MTMEAPANSGSGANPPMPSENVKHWTEAAFNIAKIAALVAAAIWTVYQWNKVIFPKESAEEFARRVASRTDLAIDANFIQFRLLSAFPAPVQGDRQPPRAATPPGAQAIYVFGEFTITNQKGFPIELQVKELDLRFGRLRLGSEKLTAESISAAPVEWIESFKLDPSVLSPGQAVNPVIETKGAIGVPVNKLFYFVPGVSRYIPVELELQGIASAVDPQTGIRIAESRKEKKYRLSVVLDITNAADPAIRGLASKEGQGTRVGTHNYWD